jgi:hypothetical protein
LVIRVQWDHMIATMGLYICSRFPFIFLFLMCNNYRLKNEMMQSSSPWADLLHFPDWLSSNSHCQLFLLVFASKLTLMVLFSSQFYINYCLLIRINEVFPLLYHSFPRLHSTYKDIWHFWFKLREYIVYHSLTS